MDDTLPSTLLYELSLECDFDILPDLAQCSLLLNNTIHDHFFIKNKFKKKEILDAINDDDLDWALASAAQGGYRDLCEVFIKKCVGGFNWALAWAAKGGHRDLCEWFIELGADNFNFALTNAAWGEHRNLCEWFIKLGADDFNTGLKFAAWGGNRNLCEWFISLGAEGRSPNEVRKYFGSFCGAIYKADQGGHLELVEWLKIKQKEYTN